LRATMTVTRFIHKLRLAQQNKLKSRMGIF
jgi:hypothetical protein